MSARIGEKAAFRKPERLSGRLAWVGDGTSVLGLKARVGLPRFSDVQGWYRMSDFRH
mgnify:CR=1 FL=1